MNNMDASLQFQKFLWLGVIIVAALFLGAKLATEEHLLLGLMAGGLLWMMLLPYHANIATLVSIATFGSALILPLPGRPYVWEFCAMLGWSGLVIVIALRRYAPNSGEMIRRNKWLFIGAIGYCLVLVMIMYYRGVGFRLFGGTQIGGRLYLQQLLCAVFPLLFALRPLRADQVVRLFSIQCWMAGTFLISDFVFSYGGTSLFGLLYFFELPGDGINFERQSIMMGIRRFQSLFLIAQALLLLLFTRYNLRDFTRARTLWLWPVAIGLLVIGLLSGHRYLLVTLTLVLFVCAWAQRFFTVERTLAISLVLAVGLGFAYNFAQELPLAAQRTLSLLPGIQVNRVAREDGEITWEGRKDLRKLGWQLAPQYRWVGRGFRKNEVLGGQEIFYGYLDPDTFFNGFIGMLVNTGVPGTVCFIVFLGAGTMTAFRILNRLRRFGIPDTFARVCCVLAAHWVSSAVIFLFLHGDSEFAMKTFSLQAALLLVCEEWLRRRLTAPALVEEDALLPAVPPFARLPVT